MDKLLSDIQAKLRELGHDPGPIDGIWGAQTRDAIAAHLGLKKVVAKALELPWMTAARAQLGVKELAGAADSPAVQAYFRDAVGVAHADSVPWCAAFVGAMLANNGYKTTGSLMARSFLNYGTVLDKPKEGAVVVFARGSAPAGHVGFVDSFTASTVRCLGGNQSDAVTVANFARSKVLGYRWPVAA